MTTHDKLVEAAIALMDTGGEAAVTLRAVGQATGLSHNAPYRHFKNREALLAAVATTDLRTFTSHFADIRGTTVPETDKLLAAIDMLVDFSRKRPSRYRLIFDAPTFDGDHPELHDQNKACLAELTAMVEACKVAGLFPQGDTKSLTSLLLAAMHGLVLLDANAQLGPEKGLPTVKENLRLMMNLLSAKPIDRRIPQ